MEEFFFIPMNFIALVLLAVFVAVMGWLLILAWRNRILFKLGIRNIPRRPAQTALIILGLMLSTLIITSALGTGDTMTGTLNAVAIRDMGYTDEVISDPSDTDDGTREYFEYSRFENLRNELSGYDKVDGLLPMITGRVLMVNETKRQNESNVGLFAPDSDYLSGFGQMTTEQGHPVTLDDLGDNEVYLDREAAKSLKATPDDQLLLIFNRDLVFSFNMKAVIKDTSAGDSSLVILPLSKVQELLGREEQITDIYVSNKGDQITGADYSDEVAATLEGLLEGTGLEVNTEKKDALQTAELAGNAFTTLFFVFGLFSIAAGLLLILLIFSMLAAARKSEMGMARAVGAKKHHLMQMFLFEGTIYDLVAAIVGVVLGIAVTYGIAGIMAHILDRILPEAFFELAYHIEPRSMIIAFVLGMLVTFLAITISSWRVVQLNIVRSIRDIPEPRLAKVGRLWLFFSIPLIFLGSILVLTSFALEYASILYLGVSLLIIGVTLLSRWFGLKARPTFSLAGILLLIWSLLPVSILEPILSDMTMGIEMFFFSGIMMVLGAVWLVIYNLNLLLRILTAVLGWLRGITPALKIAVAHAADNRLRTGLTLAMFALVIFTLIFMSATINASAPLFQDAELVAGGYDIMGTISSVKPIPDISESISNAAELNKDDFESIASQSTKSLDIRQSEESSQEWESYPLRGVDEGYLDNNSFEFAVMADGYSSAREIWQALKKSGNYAVISADAVPSRSQFAISVGEGGFIMEGVYQEDDVMSPVEIEVKGRDKGLTVIGVLNPTSFNRGIYTSQDSLDEIVGFHVAPTTYLFMLADGVDAKVTAKAIESEFFTYGMEAKSIKEVLEEQSEIYSIMNTLLQGFMSLGLVVGIAALGVISTRAVVERRHEIGVLRAIGYQRRTVQLSFLLESSILALLGIVTGIVLALLLSYNVIDVLKEQTEGLEFQIPWAETLIISGVAYGAALLMTYIPAWRASKIYPAEALRYE